ncbi:hypothetical protein R3P38DRAFT_3347228 [Favolaschia claudopus]|uniref:BTB domain-containing protein n=1 Tax=Favolaschia claudopus TaxID=2862362 RepID=A0AAW0D0Z3_9AGAR
MTVETSHALSLQEATRNSTNAWQRDLAILFKSAKDRFPDVVWELTTDDSNNNSSVEQVWGHKAIVYARAPPSFQSRYFSFRPQDPLAASALSLDIPRPLGRSPSPYERGSPAPSTSGGLTRLTSNINPALFSNELEYLYTGQGFGEAFEFLFDEQAEQDGGDALDAEELRIDKLRKDLVFMWRSRLYSDVRVALTSNAPAIPSSSTDDDDAHDKQMPVFSSHRFVLASRSPYFHTALLSWPSPKSLQSPSDPITLSLPSPPFTPASLHFTLGFLYTGTLIFSHRTYDLTTALALLLSATYLSLPTLHAEVSARIITEMAHGLFHAALPFSAYEELTRGAWRAGGCTCRKCAGRVPRILEFALRDDVKDAVLERGSRRALVGLFGTGWCTQEFSGLPAKLQSSALKGLAKRTTPANALAILWAAEAARARLSSMVDAWADVVRPLIDSGRAHVDFVMANQTAEVFAEADWTAITMADGVRFEDGERVEWAMRSVVRGVAEGNAGRVYQALVNVLLLPHPDPPADGEDSFPARPLLSQTSHVRVQVEQARMDVLQWLKRGGRGRADRVAREGGLDGVEPWAVREIADFLEIPADDLLAAIPPVPGQPTRQPTAASARKSAALLSAKDADQHSLSIHTQQSSMRVSVLSRNIPTPQAARSVRKQTNGEPGTSGGASNHEEEGEEGEGGEPDISGERPDSKLTPELGAGLFPSLESVANGKGKGRANGNGNGFNSVPPSPTVGVKRPPVPTRAVPPSPAASTSSLTSASGATTPTSKYARSTVSVSVSPPQTQPRPRSAASSRHTTVHPPRPGSAASARSTSTVRTTRTLGLRPPPVGTAGVGTARRASGASSSAGASVTDFRTAIASSRSRQSSTSSVASRHTNTTHTTRSRRASNASDVSVRTTGASTSTAGGRPPVPALDPSVKRRGPPSVRSMASSTSTMDTAASAARKAAAVVKKPETKVITLKQRGPRAGAAKEKEKEKEKELQKEKEKEKESQPPKMVVSEAAAEEEEGKEKDHRKTDSTASTASASTLKVKRKGSGDTVSTVTTKAGGATPSTASGSTTRASTATQSKTATKPPPKRPAPPPSAAGALKDLLPMSPRGATLEIGIPCIISSKRKRFKAFARYIGEVEGESGPWVGVEVPASAADGLGNPSGGGQQWHDGSWGGIRYFEIVGSGAGSESEYGDEASNNRAARRRRLEGSGASGYGFGGTQKGIKRQGDSSLGGSRGAKRIRSASPAVSDVDGPGETRGLFVRPSAVLYVVDAVGADL